MPSSPAPHCHHVRASGIRCGSFALRDKRYCYYHQRARPLIVRFSRQGRDPVLLPLPLFEDAHSIQSTLHSVVYHFLDGTVGPKTAGLLFYAMQIASSNLKQMKTETPKPDESIVDPPELSEIPSPEPAEETVRMNSHSARRTHFSHPPTAKDEYYDDIMRQARVLREHPEQTGKEAFSADLPRDLESARNSLEGDWVTQGRERMQAEEKKSAAKKSLRDDDASSDKLPPGTIHGCTETRRLAGMHR